LLGRRESLGDEVARDGDEVAESGGLLGQATHFVPRSSHFAAPADVGDGEEHAAVEQRESQ
jgi:hypothetical protein